MTQRVRSPLKRIGGKSAAAERIVSLFPAPSSYTVYCEPCGGAAHVLFAKPRYHHDEVWNDLENNLVVFWEQMKLNVAAMQERLDGILYSRKLYYDYYRSLFDGTALEPLERAARYFYVLRSTGTGWMRRSPVGWNHLASNLNSFHAALELFEMVSERMQNVVIDNRNVLDTIQRYDSPKTLFYLDPPYFEAEHYYEASRYDGFPHEELAQMLQTIKGKVALSYYPHPNIDRWYSDWYRTTWQQTKSSEVKYGEPGQATELLLTNYQPEERISLWDKVG